MSTEKSYEEVAAEQEIQKKRLEVTDKTHQKLVSLDDDDDESGESGGSDEKGETDGE